ncbi:amino acid ABC transporter permease [Agrobacterium salinitolerans]|uniref:amino acid ABC transporter permease n=1 Tax=Agrobacterium salinitolerans TaxID=1183413 RepID=UPI0030B8E961
MNTFFIAGGLGLAYLLWPRAPFRRLGLTLVIVALPLTGFIFLSGWDAVGLPDVPTNLWGGLMVTIVVAAVGIATALPVGILLALGRRSHLVIVRWLSIGLIELPRGVPLVTVLFMANTMLPLFLPTGLNPDKLVRALVGITFFAAAYLAEIIRGGLQAIPRGQYEAASALGLGYWKTMVLIILPQALKVAVPNIVSINIGLFKDTSLLLIVGIFDFLSTIETARIDPRWAAPTISTTGYAFAAVVYFSFCFGMSRYGALIERRLSRDHGR